MANLDQKPERVFAKEFFVQMTLIHLVTIFVAPFYFSGAALAFAFFMTVVTGYSLGIFHHMLLSHRSFKTSKWVEYLGTLFATLTWRGPMAAPIRYVAMHRIHHAFSDKELDPHSPIHGKWHAIMGWFWNIPKRFLDEKAYHRYAGKISKDPVHLFMDRNVHLIQGLWGILCFALGYFLFGGSIYDGLSFLIYGVFVKSFLVIYLANAVDLLNHTQGYRNYETGDTSTNSWIMAILHGGGAITWHNNHHAHPGYFYVKKKWWEFDIHYYFLLALEKVGLVTDIKVLDEVRQIKISEGPLDHVEGAI